MKVYLVFGDPRRAKERVLFMQDLPPKEVEVAPTSARVHNNSRVLEGGLLSYAPSGDKNGDSEPFVSLLISESQPSRGLKKALEAAGWRLIFDYPPPQHLPFLVQTNLLVNTGENIDAWTKPMWFPHAFVPTQRTTLHLPGSQDVSVRCLSMTLHKDRAHEAIFEVEGSHSVDLDFLRFDGWTHATVSPLSLSLLSQAAAAVEVQVTYVLGATIVSGVIIHDIEALDNRGVLSCLPGDVLDETIYQLYDLNREDLVPEELRMQPPES